MMWKAGGNIIILWNLLLLFPDPAILRHMIPGKACGISSIIRVVPKLTESMEPHPPCTIVQDPKSFQKYYVNRFKLDFRYTDWSPCSASCGPGGTKSRLQQCFVGGILATPEQCEGFVTRNITGVPCIIEACPVVLGRSILINKK